MKKNQETKGELKKELLKGGVFLAWFAAFAFAAFLVLSIPFIANLFAWLAATLSNFLLNAFGVPTTIEWREFPHLLSRGFDAEVGDVCWGKLEFAVLFGIIFASADRSLRSRAKGFAAGLALLALVFNPIRIAVSLAFVHPIVHDVLFRLTLVAVLVVYYALWYTWLSAPSARKRVVRGKKVF